jgi:hypothetical protein
MNVLGHHYFARSLRETSQIKFKGNLAPTVAKFDPALKTGAEGTAGARDDGSPAAAKRQKTGGSAKLRVSSNFDRLTRRSNPPRGEARSDNPQTAAAAFGKRSPEVIPSDEEPDEEEQGLMGGAARAKAFANDDLVSEVIERHVPTARVLEPRHRARAQVRSMR